MAKQGATSCHGSDDVVRKDRPDWPNKVLQAATGARDLRGPAAFTRGLGLLRELVHGGFRGILLNRPTQVQSKSVKHIAVVPSATKPNHQRRAWNHCAQHFGETLCEQDLWSHEQAAGLTEIDEIERQSGDSLIRKLPSKNPSPTRLPRKRGGGILAWSSYTDTSGGSF